MEKSRRIANATLEGLSKTQQKKRRRRKYPNVFFKKELVQVFESIDNPRTMIAAFLTFFCALRNSEVCKLEWKDIDLTEARLKVVDGKNHKDGFIPISPLAIPILKKWREINPNEQYFISSDMYKTGHYQSNSLLKDFKKALRRAGLEIPTEKNSAGMQQHQYKYHTLRHSRCTHLLSNGVPVEKVQKFMRHDDLETTMGYTWILDKEMNKMVAQADIHSFDVLAQPATQPVSEQVKVNPLELAQKRLACGEITLREYQKIARALAQII
jgi:integrase